MLSWPPWCKEKERPCEQQKEEVVVVAEGEEEYEDCIDIISTRNSIFDHIYFKRPVTIIEDIFTMGACLSGGAKASLIVDPDGDEKDFHNRYIYDRILGEGEFGVVNLVHDMRAEDQNDNTMACKTLRKGAVFKDNTLYSPVKPEVLRGEVNILRKLGGQHYCMAVKGVYETNRVIYLVTEYCAGGEMMEYVSKQEEDLRTEDVSRVASQMLDAINHCAKHNIIHRDIKPENVMFRYPSPGSDLRLIDFGSGTDKVVEGNHTTFAGSAFYISPEMFQRTYVQKTDVWSVGVTLYVLVAGYPAEVLQKAFNLLHTANRNLKDLPNLPDDMPDSFYDMLEGLLVYRHRKRKSAGEMLEHEFVQFHRQAFTVEAIAAQAQAEAADQESKEGETRSTMRRTQSISIRGSVGRHSMFLDYQRYERSLTTLLATLLDKSELNQLMKALDQRVSDKKEERKEEAVNGLVESKLDVIQLNELKELLVAQNQEQV